ncbi:hypothetical protein [Natrinema halophilum]|uniref:Uncharacterized protein n=1 Tax=Natrinema halophilum TaxID=1699371 RepID=A0A7D5GN51_9EURY|nr:hypothetical protein [Natrinema halophilum]QLG49093.1 hypothetical protein HYG82_09640 [Natrinema halophilum]
MSDKNNAIEEAPEWALGLIEMIEQNAKRIDEIEASSGKSAVSDSGYTLRPDESRHRGKQLLDNRQARKKVPSSGESEGAFTLDPRKTKLAAEDTDEPEDENEKEGGFTLDPRRAE